MNENSITSLLKEKHSDDIFASQCKLGSMGSKIIDAVAIKKSWSPITIIGYEIKTSRSDFLNDHKYPEYMKCCHEFNFVAPYGLINISELPNEVGLLEVTKDGTRLRTKRKSAYRAIEINNKMLLHIMFWKLEQYKRPMTKGEALQRAKDAVESKEYGHKLGQKLWELEWKLKDNRYKDESERYNNILKAYRDKFGQYYIDESNIIDLINSNTGIPSITIDSLNRNIDSMKKIIDSMKKEAI
jgi:hypothetical protein